MSMSDLPSVSTSRVGKSRFAPVVSGRKCASSVSLSQAVPAPESVTDIPEITFEDIVSSSVDAHALIPQEKPLKKTAIRPVQSRREQRSSDSGSFRACLAKLSPATLWSGDGANVTLSYFLKDTGEGIPMSSSGSSSTMSSGRSTPATSVLVPCSPAMISNQSVTQIVAPKVRIVNGEIVLDDDSLVMSAPSAPSALFPMSAINETGKHLTSHAFVRRSGNNRWKKEDTELFYDVPVLALFTCV